MKKFLTLLVISLVSLESWADIEYRLRYNMVTDMYEVSFVSTASYLTANVGPSQVTIAFDSTFNTADIATTSPNGTGPSWAAQDKIVGNTGTLDAKKVVDFQTAGSAITGGVVTGTEYRLFTFTFGAGQNCGGKTLRLFVNNVDPTDPNGQGGDFTSYLNIGGDDQLSTNSDSVFKDLCAGALPVHFLSFVAKKIGNTAVLNWNVANENPITQYYELQRSINKVDFRTVVSVPAKNNGKSNNGYDFTDPNLSALNSTGIIYYRLKQVDADGNFVYSEIRPLRLIGNGIGVYMYPNPAKNFTNVTIELEQAFPITMRITDAAGKEIKKIEMPGIKGTNIKRIDLPGLATGAYMLNVHSGDLFQTVHFMKGR